MTYTDSYSWDEKLLWTFGIGYHEAVTQQFKCSRKHLLTHLHPPCFLWGISPIVYR
jgi:hypothetical protein